MFSFVCLMILVSSGAWLLVLRPDIRWRLGSSWLTNKLTKEQREFRDAVALAVSVIAGVTSTTLLISVLIISMVTLSR